MNPLRARRVSQHVPTRFFKVLSNQRLDVQLLHIQSTDRHVIVQRHFSLHVGVVVLLLVLCSVGIGLNLSQSQAIFTLL
jgi:hypothetical protein